MLHIISLVMNGVNKTEFAIFSSLMWPLLPKDLTNQKLMHVRAIVRSIRSIEICKVLHLAYPSIID